MDSKDAQQPEKKSETPEERATRLEAELKKAKKAREKAKKAGQKARKEAEKVKKELEEEKKRKGDGDGSRKRKQEEDAVVAGAPKGPRQQWKKPKREEHPQGNVGARPLQATAAPFIPARPSAPSFGHSEVQEATPMPVPIYLPPDYRRQWEQASSFSGQVLVYRRYVERNMTFYLAPPEGLSQEHTRRWIGGSVEDQRRWGAQLAQEQGAGGTGAPSGPSSTYGAPGGTYGQPSGYVQTSEAPRAPERRLFPRYPNVLNPPVASQTASRPGFGARLGANQWVSEDYVQRQEEAQRERAEKARKEKEEKEAMEKKRKEEEEKAEMRRQKKFEKNKKANERKREKKQAQKQAEGKDEAKDEEQVVDDDMLDLEAPWSEVAGQTTEGAITQAIANRRSGDEAALRDLHSRRANLLAGPEGDLSAEDLRLVEALIDARQGMLDGLRQLEREALGGVDEVTSVETQMGQRIGTLVSSLNAAVTAANERYSVEVMSFNAGRRAQAAAGRLQIDQAYAEGPSSELPLRLALPQQTSFVIPGAELFSQDIGNSVVRASSQMQTQPQHRESSSMGPVTGTAENRIVDVEEEEADRDFHAFNTAGFELFENLAGDDELADGPE